MWRDKQISRQRYGRRKEKNFHEFKPLHRKQNQLSFVDKGKYSHPGYEI